MCAGIGGRFWVQSHGMSRGALRVASRVSSTGVQRVQAALSFVKRRFREITYINHTHNTVPGALPCTPHGHTAPHRHPVCTPYALTYRNPDPHPDTQGHRRTHTRPPPRTQMLPHLACKPTRVGLAMGAACRTGPVTHHTQRDTGSTNVWRKDLAKKVKERATNAGPPGIPAVML